jgi:hypothetical protein
MLAYVANNWILVGQHFLASCANSVGLFKYLVSLAGRVATKDGLKVF